MSEDSCTICAQLRLIMPAATLLITLRQRIALSALSADSGPAYNALQGVCTKQEQDSMQTIGLIGGMSWESSIEYYRIINETVRERLGGLHSAQSLMYSVDFATIEALQHAGRWDEAATILAEAAQRLEAGGADMIVLCTNTMHKLADAITAHCGLPLLHIADATAERIRAAGFQRVGLLGTQFTMEERFYRGRLEDRYALTVIVPEAPERAMIHRVIYDELCQGLIRPESRAAYVEAMGQLVARGAECIILGCTEITLLVQAGDSAVPLFDTTRIHAVAAVERALAAR
jgi:aspartate racemase